MMAVPPFNTQLDRPAIGERRKKRRAAVKIDEEEGTFDHPGPAFTEWSPGSTATFNERNEVVNGDGIGNCGRKATGAGIIARSSNANVGYAVEHWGLIRARACRGEWWEILVRLRTLVGTAQCCR